MSAAGLAPWKVDARRTAIAISYTNEDFISDLVMPRVNVGGERFLWNEYRLGETYKLQDTLVGRKGVPNEMEFGWNEKEATTEDHGLDDVIPQKDLDNAPAGTNPIDNATTRLTERILLAREKRVADLTFNAANYAYSTALTGSNRFSDPTSDPIGVIQDAIDDLPRGANTFVMSRPGFTTLRRHPKIVRAYNGNDGGDGLVPVDFIKELFNVQNVHIGAAWVDSTRRSTTGDSVANLTRLWGLSMAILYINPRASAQDGVTWGFTGQWKNRFVATIPEPKLGLEGGQRVRVGEHVKEIVAAKEYGYLLGNAFV